MKVKLSNMAARRRASICSARPWSWIRRLWTIRTASELKTLAASAVSAPPPVRSGRARDEMSYTITIEDDGSQTVLSQSDTAMSADFGKLLAWLRRHPGK